MTEKELFIKFCKMNKLMPFLMTKFYEKKPKIYKRQNGKYSQYECNFDEYFHSKLISCCTFFNLYHLFHKIFDELTSWGTETNDEYKKALRKWKYFVRSNVFCKNIEIGDTIIYSFYNGGPKMEAVVKEVFKQYSTALVTNKEEKYDKVVYLDWIEEVNGNKFKKDYYIKYKGKTYGID